MMDRNYGGLLRTQRSKKARAAGFFAELGFSSRAWRSLRIPESGCLPALRFGEAAHSSFSSLGGHLCVSPLDHREVVL